MEKGIGWKQVRDGVLALTLMSTFGLAAGGVVLVFWAMARASGVEAMLACVAGVLSMLPFVQAVMAARGKHLGYVALVAETIVTGGLGGIFLFVRYCQAQYEKANARTVFYKGKNGEFFRVV